MRARCPSVTPIRLERTEAEHELRYVFNLVRYSRFGAPRSREIVHSGMLARMLFIVFLCVYMMGVGWCTMSPVVQAEPGGGDQ